MRFTLLKQANIQLSMHSPDNWKRWPKYVLSQNISHWSNRSGNSQITESCSLVSSPIWGFRGPI